MDTQLPYNDLSWELILQALQGELSPEDERAFQQWLAGSEENRHHFEHLQRLWKEEMNDYPIYLQGSEDEAWGELQHRMDEIRVDQVLGSGRKRKGRVINLQWAAVAAILLVLAGGEWWYVARKNGMPQYATAANELKQVSLPDGTKIDLSGETQIRVGSGYNKADRKLVLISGTARFDVVHYPDRPFTVDMGDVSVKDIGTSFTIQRTADSIKVAVWEGRVAFVRRATGETRELTEGKEESFYIADNRFGAVGVRNIGLRFDDQPLSAVTAALEKAWGRKTVVSDPVLAHKRLTVHLEGESFEDAIKTICASLNLAYRVENGAYVLRSKE